MVIQEVSPVFMAMVREPVLGRIDIGLSVTLKMAVTRRFSLNIGAGIRVLTTTMTCVIDGLTLLTYLTDLKLLYMLMAI